MKLESRFGGISENRTLRAWRFENSNRRAPIWGRQSEIETVSGVKLVGDYEKGDRVLRLMVNGVVLNSDVLIAIGSNVRYIPIMWESARLPTVSERKSRKGSKSPVEIWKAHRGRRGLIFDLLARLMKKREIRTFLKTQRRGIRAGIWLISQSAGL